MSTRVQEYDSLDPDVQEILRTAAFTGKYYEDTDPDTFEGWSELQIDQPDSSDLFGDGEITKQELMDFGQTENNATRAISIFDTDKDEQIDYDEFNDDVHYRQFLDYLDKTDTTMDHSHNNTPHSANNTAVDHSHNTHADLPDYALPLSITAAAVVFLSALYKLGLFITADYRINRALAMAYWLYVKILKVNHIKKELIPTINVNKIEKALQSTCAHIPIIHDFKEDAQYMCVNHTANGIRDVQRWATRKPGCHLPGLDETGQNPIQHSIRVSLRGKIIFIVDTGAGIKRIKDCYYIYVHVTNSRNLRRRQHSSRQHSSRQHSSRQRSSRQRSSRQRSSSRTSRSKKIWVLYRRDTHKYSFVSMQKSNVRGIPTNLKPRWYSDAKQYVEYIRNLIVNKQSTHTNMNISPDFNIPTAPMHARRGFKSKFRETKKESNVDGVLPILFARAALKLLLERTIATNELRYDTDRQSWHCRLIDKPVNGVRIEYTPPPQGHKSTRRNHTHVGRREDSTKQRRGASVKRGGNKRPCTENTGLCGTVTDICDSFDRKPKSLTANDIRTYLSDYAHRQKSVTVKYVKEPTAKDFAHALTAVRTQTLADIISLHFQNNPRWEPPTKMNFIIKTTYANRIRKIDTEQRLTGITNVVRRKVANIVNDGRSRDDLRVG